MKRHENERLRGWKTKRRIEDMYTDGEVAQLLNKESKKNSVGVSRTETNEREGLLNLIYPQFRQRPRLPCPQRRHPNWSSTPAPMASSLILRSSLPRALTAHHVLLRTLPARHATSSASNYIPGGPIYKGTVNDPTTFPTPSKSAGSHHWAFERLLSAGLVPLTAAAFVTSGTSHPVLDGLLGISLVMHSHIGFDAVLVDYLHKRKFPILGPVATWTLRTVTLGVLVGVYQFNTNDIGLTELIARVWTA